MTTEPKPKPFNIKLSDDDREALERVRVMMGARSHADAVRWLIRNNGALTVTGAEKPKAQSYTFEPTGPTTVTLTSTDPRFEAPPQAWPIVRKPGSMLKKAKK